MNTINGSNEKLPVNIDDFPTRITDDISACEAEDAFRLRLQQLSLDPLTLELFVLRFVYDMTLTDIARELNITSAMTALNLLNKGLKKLKGILHE